MYQSTPMGPAASTSAAYPDVGSRTFGYSQPAVNPAAHHYERHIPIQRPFHTLIGPRFEEHQDAKIAALNKKLLIAYITRHDRGTASVNLAVRTPTPCSHQCESRRHSSPFMSSANDIEMFLNDLEQTLEAHQCNESFNYICLRSLLTFYFLLYKVVYSFAAAHWITNQIFGIISNE